MSNYRYIEIPQEIYVAILNRTGFHYNKPLKVYWEEQSKGWKDVMKKVFITKLGLSVRDHSISYSSPEREKVQSWMLGIRCCNQMHKTSPMVEFSSLDENFLCQKRKQYDQTNSPIRDHVDIEDSIEKIKIQ